MPYKFGFGSGSENSRFTGLSFLLRGIESLIMFDFQTWILAIFSPEKWNKYLLPNLYWQLLSPRWDGERARWPDAVPTELRKAREQVPKSEPGEGWEHLSLALTREMGSNWSKGGCWRALPKGRVMRALKTRGEGTLTLPHPLTLPGNQATVFQMWNAGLEEGKTNPQSLCERSVTNI